ncbi:MAG: hypothetical protein R6U67_08195 [Sodalinema sp.]|uniref:hypothetical protein n=1 Tax=Sodalinema sp. TaxID=3080550 RepID=UPI001228D8F8|nr:MAG: hypothetical protein EYR95_11245 [Phormidium sp. SL48-SHIP]
MESGDVGQVADEVIQHLTSLNNAKIRITLEIDADIPEGIPEDVARTVLENCKTLKFEQQTLDSETLES